MTSKPKLYCAWFCPFAQRAWIAMNEKNVDYEYIEINPYEKTPEWLAINPNGAAPAIVHDGKSIYESAICVEYIDENWEGQGKILTGDAYSRARQRILGDSVGKKLLMPFFGFLISGDENGRDNLLKGLKEMTAEMDAEGPFFLGKEFSYVDLVMIPIPLRFPLIKKYRGFEMPTEDQGGHWPRFYKWFNACVNHPSVKKTIADEDKLIKFYSDRVKNV